MTTDDMIRDAAKLLREAEATRQPCSPVRELISADDIDTAYAVQSLNIEHDIASGRRVVGRKIGLTAKVVQTQLGVDQPDFGVLFADMAVNDDEPVDRTELIAPRVEAEVAFVLESDLVEPINTAVDVVRATDFVIPAIEIVDSRVKDWDIKIADTVADNASSGRYVLGTTPRLLRDVDVRGVTMAMRFGEHEVSSGGGAACLGNPVNAVVWLANELARRNTPLRAGDIVLSGALGPMASVSDPGTYEAPIIGLGTVRATFA